MLFGFAFWLYVQGVSPLDLEQLRRTVEGQQREITKLCKRQEMTNNLLTKLINLGLDRPLSPIRPGMLPKQQDKLRLICLLTITLSPEEFVKSLSIVTYDEEILWTHNYVLYAQSGGAVPLIAAGGGLSAELSKVRQVYHTLNNTTCWSRDEYELRVRGTPISFPPCDDRSLVTMVEAGDVKHEGFKSIMIRRIEPDSRFCEVIFERDHSAIIPEQEPAVEEEASSDDEESSGQDATAATDENYLSPREQAILDGVESATEHNHALFQQYSKHTDIGLLFFDILATCGSRIPHPAMRIPSSLYLAGRGLHKITSRVPPKLASRAQGSGGGSAGTGKTRIQNPHKAQSAVWKGFKRHNKTTKTNGEQGSKREYYQWDHTHNDIEVYDHTMKHKGSMDPVTGQISKPAVPGRDIKK